MRQEFDSYEFDAHIYFGGFHVVVNITASGKLLSWESEIYLLSFDSRK